MAFVNKATHDLKAAEIGIEDEAPLDTVAFHLRQCAEKLIKAFLNLKQVQYLKRMSLAHCLICRFHASRELRTLSNRTASTI
jgi:HEPN domain-containing protein